MQADGKLLIEVIARKKPEVCPHCGIMCVKEHDVRKRKKRDVPLRGHPVELVLHKRRFWSLKCHKAFTESERACGKRKRTTARLREEIGKQACQRPIAQVAQAYEGGPRFVQENQLSQATIQFAKGGLSLDESTKLPTPRFLGRDEFARRKGHRYDTIQCDLEARKVLEISEGRTLEEVQTLLERLDNPDAVEAVSMDMSASFRPAVQLCLPKAQLVVDHFHVVQHVMKGFKKIVSRWAHKKEGKPLLRGKQHLFLTAKENLTEEQAQERSQMGEALPHVEAAWPRKEALRTWSATATVATAAIGLDAWIEQVQKSGFDHLRKTLSAFRNWRQEMLAFFQFVPTRLSHGFVEGKNNRTKALMRQGYGYRNRQHLRLRIVLGNVA